MLKYTAANPISKLLSQSNAIGSEFVNIPTERRKVNVEKLMRDVFHCERFTKACFRKVTADGSRNVNELQHLPTKLD